MGLSHALARLSGRASGGWPRQVPPAAKAPQEPGTSGVEATRGGAAKEAAAARPVSDYDASLVAELGRLNEELRRSDLRYRELNERYMRNRAAALALGSIYLRIRNELSRLKKDPKQPRKLTDPSRLPILEKTRSLIEEHELRALSGGRISPKDPNPNW
ncbi:MAG TPA: hypothetical protein VMU33_09220 [Burkholderiaceae bacterium]|nr:hypothetical protein [Burkholderiaceae bacterium]